MKKRYNHMKQPRVGSPNAHVLPGDPTPSGGFYRRGQFAPSLEELGSETLERAAELHLIPQNISIFNDNGVIVPKKLAEWSPEQDSVPLGEELKKLPKYLAVLVSSALLLAKPHIIPSGVRKFSHLGAGGSLALGDDLVSLRVYASGSEFYSEMVIGRKFYYYSTVPVLRPVAGVSWGLSLSLYAVLHTLGRSVYERMRYVGPAEPLLQYLAAAEWSPKENGHQEGSFFLKPSDAPWYRRPGPTPTELSKYTPEYDFAEAFALYHVNPDYLKTFGARYDAMKQLLASHE